MGDASFDNPIISSDSPQKETFLQKSFIQIQNIRKYFKPRIILPIFFLLVMMIGLPVSLLLSQQSQDIRNRAQEYTPEAGTDTVDTLSYFLGSSPSHHLNGSSGGINLAADSNQRVAYYVKWANNVYERYTWDDQYIYLARDTSWGTGGPYPDASNYTFSNGKWMKRTMNIGDTVAANPNQLSCFTDNCTTCSQNPGWSHPFENKLVDHISSFDTAADPDASAIGGSDIGTQDIIVLQYGTGSVYEKFYYSKEWGFIKWEAWNTGSRTQFAVWYKKTGGFRSPQPMCGDPSVNAPVPTSGTNPTPSGTGNPLRVQVKQKGTGEKYPYTLSVSNVWVSNCGTGGQSCTSGCSNPICSYPNVQTYNPASCNGTGCAEWLAYGANVNYAIMPCTKESPADHGCGGKTLLRNGWKVTKYGCGNYQKTYKAPASGATCSIEVEKELKKYEVNGYLFDDGGNKNAIKNAENNEPSLSGVQLEILLVKPDGSNELTLTDISSKDLGDRNYRMRNVTEGSYKLQISPVSGYQLHTCSTISVPANSKNIPSDYHFFYCLDNGTLRLMKWTQKAYKAVENNILTLNKNTVVDFPMEKIPTPTLTPTP